MSAASLTDWGPKKESLSLPFSPGHLFVLLPGGVLSNPSTKPIGFIWGLVEAFRISRGSHTKVVCSFVDHTVARPGMKYNHST